MTGLNDFLTTNAPTDQPITPELLNKVLAELRIPKPIGTMQIVTSIETRDKIFAYMQWWDALPWWSKKLRRAWGNVRSFVKELRWKWLEYRMERRRR